MRPLPLRHIDGLAKQGTPFARAPSSHCACISWRIAYCDVYCPCQGRSDSRRSSFPAGGRDRTQRLCGRARAKRRAAKRASRTPIRMIGASVNARAVCPERNRPSNINRPPMKPTSATTRKTLASSLGSTPSTYLRRRATVLLEEPRDSRIIRRGPRRKARLGQRAVHIPKGRRAKQRRGGSHLDPRLRVAHADDRFQYGFGMTGIGLAR